VIRFLEAYGARRREQANSPVDVLMIVIRKERRIRAD
jgi:hypothetical protein